jgi:C1A family cysteine protease
MLLFNKKKYSVRKDRSDWRDRIYNFKLADLRESVDLRKWASPIENQLHLGSCAGQAVVGAYELLLNKQYPDQFVDLSRLFVYYNARLLENTVDEDSGVYLRDAVKAVKQYGVCTELQWPYVIENYKMPPGINSYVEARHRTIKEYRRITNLNQMLDAINADCPVVFGTQVYDSFENLNLGDTVLPMPQDTENILGAHAMCMVGYDRPKRLLLARNSFGVNWCINGYCWIPFDYADDNFMDMWTIDIELK